jgi:hypothetical protein
MAAPMTKDQYIEAILEALKECNDLDVVDLAYRIILKTVAC